jgi:hypothetical protein
MNSVKVAPIGGSPPAAPVVHASPGASAVGAAIAEQAAAQAARARAEQSAAAQAQQKAAKQAAAAAAAQAAPPAPVYEPRFDRKVGFLPGTQQVYIDLVGVENQKMSYRIYGPRPGVLPTPAPQPPTPVGGGKVDTTA